LISVYWIVITSLIQYDFRLVEKIVEEH